MHQNDGRSIDQLREMSIAQLRNEMTWAGINVKGLRLKEDLVQQYFQNQKQSQNRPIPPVSRVTIRPLSSPRKTLIIPGLSKPRGKGKLQQYAYGEIGRRPTMEDEHLMTTLLINDVTVTLWCVFDGHGGKMAAIRTKGMLPGILESHLQPIDLQNDVDIRTAIEEAFLEWDLKLFTEMGPRGGSRSDGSGTTAVIALLLPEKLVIANLGDSRAIVFNDGDLLLETRDHKPDASFERERLNEVGGVTYEGRLWGGSSGMATSRAFGDYDYGLKLRSPDGVHLGRNASMTPIPDVYILPVASPVTLLLACDGLWDVILSADVVTTVNGLISTGSSVDSICKHLVTTSIHKLYSRDNVTTVLARIVPS